jgi:hypothetical protein
MTMSGFEERMADGGPDTWQYLGRWPIAKVPPALQEAVDDLWPRLSQDLRDLLNATSKFALGGPFTVSAVADWLEDDEATVRRRLLLLDATLDALRARFPDAGVVFDREPHSRAMRRVMSREASEAVIGKVLDDERDPGSPTQPPPWRAS